MTKRALYMLSVIAVVGLSGCNKGDGSVSTEETTSIYSTIRDNSGSVPEEALASNSQATKDLSVEIITDLKGKTGEQLISQIKSGLTKLNSKVTLGSSTAKDMLNNFLASVNLTGEELVTLGQEELYKRLEKAGLSLDEMYGYSIFNYLLEAQETGDSGVPEGFLGNTSNVLEANGCSFKDMIALRNIDELLLYIGDKDIDAESLNAKLYFNSLFPGVNLDAKALLGASSLDDILGTLEEAQLSADSLKQKSNPTKEEAGQFIGKIVELEAEKAKQEQEKGASGSSGSDGSNTSKSGASKTVDKGASTTLPAGDSNSIVSVNIANGDGYGNSSKNSSFKDGKKNATVKIGSDELNARIVVKRILRGGSAESIVSSSNSNLPGQFPTDLPNGYDMVAVKFTVTLETAKSGVAIPTVRVRNLGGTNIESVATKVFMIQPEDEDYTDSTETKTYWVAFKIPDTQGAFALHFGESGGQSYVFKSSAIDIEGYDKDDD